MREVALLHLPCGPLRQSVDDSNSVWMLVPRNLILEEIAQFFVGGRGSGVERYGSNHLLTEFLMLGTYDCGFCHGMVFVEHFFNLSGVYIKAAADDKILLTINDEEVSFVVHPTHVTSAEPAIRSKC